MRVSGGALRGRKLRTPRGRSTRPTSERARQGLYDWLGPDVAGARVLDLFAGSGALGIEALSRGAARAVFVERARAAAAALRQNLAELELEERSQLLVLAASPAVERLAAAGARFDLVLADPPYGSDAWDKLAQTGRLVDILAEHGRLVLEGSGRDPVPPAPPGLEAGEVKSYGETAFRRYERR